MAFKGPEREQILKLLAVAKAKRERDWLMILLAYQHGLRASEVLALTPDNFFDGQLTVKRLKGSKRTIHRLIENANPLLNARQAVSDFILKTGPNQRLFKITRQRFWQLVQEYGEAAGIHPTDRHPHALKHSCAQQMLPSARLNEIQQYIGHCSLDSTGQYLKVSDADASKAAQRVFGV